MAYLIREFSYVPEKRNSHQLETDDMAVDTSTWPKCPEGHPVHPGNVYCGKCGQQVVTNTTQAQDPGIRERVVNTARDILPEVIVAELIDLWQERGLKDRLAKIEERLGRIDSLLGPLMEEPQATPPPSSSTRVVQPDQPSGILHWLKTH